MIRPAGGAIAATLVLVAMSCTGTSSSWARPNATVPRFAESGVVPITGLTSRQAPAVAWSGRDLLVFGGYREGEGDQRDWLRDGALVDTETGDARDVPTAPFAAPLYFPRAARSGERIAVAGTECADYEVEEDSENFSCAKGTGRVALATFDSATGRWSRVARIPESAAPRSSPEWAAGRSVPGAYPAQVLGTRGGRTVVALDRDGARSYWLQERPGGPLTVLPDPRTVSDACVAGNRLVVAAVAPGSTTDVSLRMLDLRKPVPAWESSPAAPGAVTARVVACMGSRVMITDRYSISGAGGLVYDVTARTWADAATPPANEVPTPGGQVYAAPFYSGPAQRLWTGSELLELTDFGNPDGRTFPPSRAYDPVANAWRLLDALPVSMETPQWAESAVIDFTITRAGRPAVAHFVVR